MKKFLLGLVVLAQGCCSVSEEVAESVDVLRDNAHTLSANYTVLLERADVPTLENGPEDETDKDKAARVEGHAEAWKKHVKHENALMDANNILADRLATWTAICAGEVELKGSEDDEANASEGD